MKRTLVVVLALCGWAGGAVAQPRCQPGLPMTRSQYIAELRADGLAVSVASDRLAVWPEDRDPELNAEVGVWLEFRDGTSCQSPITHELAHGSVIKIGTRNISAVEVGLCDTQKGICFPVRISLKN